MSPTQVTVVWHGTLVKLLRSLYSLGLPEASKELRSVEQEVRWRLRRLRYRHLAFLAESSAAHMQERGSQELLAELLISLERRWAEIEDSRTLVALMTKLGHLSESLMNRLEDKVLAPSRGRAGRGRGLLSCGPVSAQCACPFIFPPNGPCTWPPCLGPGPAARLSLWPALLRPAAPRHPAPALQPSQIRPRSHRSGRRPG